MSQLDSHVVGLYGLDGKREHWMPGNRRRKLPAREKRPFESEAEALAFVGKQRDAHGQSLRVYQCSICGKWHTASPPRSGDADGYR